MNLKNKWTGVGGAVAAVALVAMLVMPAGSAQGAAAFGSQVKLGDGDFKPTTTGGGVAIAAANIKEVNFGTGNIADSCFYYSISGAGTAIGKFDVRLTPCQGHAAGTMVTDNDVTEKNGALTASGYANTVVADVNGNGRYDIGDAVYLTTGAATAIAASTGATAWSIRLTGFGSYLPGSLVKPGDTDQTSYGTNAIAFGAAPTVIFFDADLSTTQNAGDAVYLARTAPGAGTAIPLYAVRLVPGPVGTLPSQSNNPSMTTPTGTSPTGTSGSTMASSPATTPPVTTPGQTSSGNNGGGASSPTKTPGFELVAIVGGVGTALAIYRRK